MAEHAGNSALTAKFFSFDGLEVYARVVDVYDGDTCTIAFRFPLTAGDMRRFKVRLLGVDAPEMAGGEAASKALAVCARNRVISLVLGRECLQGELDSRASIRAALAAEPRIVRVKCGTFDKYGRILARVFLCQSQDLYDETRECRDLSEILLSERLAVPYACNSSPSATSAPSSHTRL